MGAVEQYVQSELSPGEQVQFQTKPYWMGKIAAAVFVALGFALCFAGDGKGIFLGLPLMAAPLIGWVQSQGTIVAVTNRRVIMRIGTRSIEMNLSKIESVAINSSNDRVGQVVIIGSGGTKETFKAMARPISLKRAIQTARDAEQHKAA